MSVAGPFGDWCDTWMRPWAEDHVAVDAERVRADRRVTTR